ncbi:DUF3226 domain-containing protein [Candidatus Palauibacter sp.]|uniref:DUF3226 domain-containing protein n=1 Tax=Candidatus Palauibacter sp. TaxID=3101350 RepID=UPI003B52A327
MRHANKLLVEGETDKRVIPYLIEHNGVPWPEKEPPVFIKPFSGVDEIMRPGVVEAELKESRLEALGIVVDADGDASARWNELKRSLGSEFVGLPDQIPTEGLTVVHCQRPRLGVWIMPDNRCKGMLEDLLVQLIPNDSTALYGLARNCVGEARRNSAPFRNVHERKAEVYTWLAWQDPPGLRLHEAVNHMVLDPRRPESLGFVTWFRNLYRL